MITRSIFSQPRRLNHTSTMKKTSTPILFLLACCALFADCHKEKLPTIIKGKVTNSVTGEPVADAGVQSSISNPNIGVNGKDNSTNTDLEGNYVLTIPPGYAWSFSNVYKPGFLPKVDPSMGHTFECGAENILDIELIPEDGFIRFILKNDLPQHDSLFIHYVSPIRQAQPYIGGLQTIEPYPVALFEGGSSEEIERFASEELIKIYWDYKDFKSIYVAPFSDSIYVSRYDTVDYTIHF